MCTCCGVFLHCASQRSWKGRREFVYSGYCDVNSHCWRERSMCAAIFSLDYNRTKTSRLVIKRGCSRNQTGSSIYGQKTSGSCVSTWSKMLSIAILFIFPKFFFFQLDSKTWNISYLWWNKISVRSFRDPDLVQSQSEFQGLHLCFLELLLGMNSKNNIQSWQWPWRTYMYL